MGRRRGRGDWCQIIRLRAGCGRHRCSTAAAAPSIFCSWRGHTAGIGLAIGTTSFICFCVCGASLADWRRRSGRFQGAQSRRGLGGAVWWWSIGLVEPADGSIVRHCQVAPGRAWVARGCAWVADGSRAVAAVSRWCRGCRAGVIFCQTGDGYQGTGRVGGCSPSR